MTAYAPAPRFIWPAGHRCAAMLCFDVDGETTALSEDPALATRRTLMSQCEYGPRIGVPRLLGAARSSRGAGHVFHPRLHRGKSSAHDARGRRARARDRAARLPATAPDRVIWYRLLPLGPERMKLLTTALVAPEILAAPDFARMRASVEASLVEFHLEDMEVCTGVQRGLYASGWQPGRLSHLEMPIWLFHRYLAARLRGVWPTDDRTPASSQRP